MKNTTPLHGFVYLIRAVGVSLVKIGYSVNPEGRLASLRTGSPMPLELVQVWAGRVADEKAIHRRLQSNGSHLEWFEISITDAVIAINTYFNKNPFTPPLPSAAPESKLTKREELIVDIDAIEQDVAELMWLSPCQKATLIGHIFELASRPRRKLSQLDNKRIVAVYKYLREINFDCIPEERHMEQILNAGKVQQAVRDIRRNRRATSDLA